jgi:hypothetical protein
VCVDIMQNRVYTRTEFRRQMFSHKAFSKLVLHAIVKVPTSCWGRPARIAFLSRLRERRLCVAGATGPSGLAAFSRRCA